MNTSQRAAAERLAKELASVHPLHPYAQMCGSAADLLRELLAEPVQEPVALMWQHEETGRVTFTTMADPYVGKRWHRIPLYAAAPQQPMHCPKDGGECGAGGYCRPEQRKPLTFGEIEGKCRNAFLLEDGYGLPSEHPERYRVFRDGFYAAWNRAHGITGEPT